MEAETLHKNCQNCAKEFLIDSDDMGFYDKMKVPPPTWCPDCRFMRRLSFWNWFSLYRRSCDSCGENIISIHHENTIHKVYCPKCWWADSWDGTEYGRDYDPSRNFFEQMIELKNASNFVSLSNMQSTLVNTPYSNATAYLKGCFMVFDGDYAERSAYVVYFANATECMDCFRVNSTELCYECVGVDKSYKCTFSEEVESCTNVHFSRALSGCTDCFGCINLRNKSYHIFNQQYSREEYKEKIESYKLDTIEGQQRAMKEAMDFWMTQPQRCTLGNGMNVATTGDMIYESKKTKNGYIITSAEDCRYVQLLSLPTSKDSYDYTAWGNHAEKMYECLVVGEGGYNDKFCMECWPAATENEYCMHAIQAKNCFGCVNLKRRQYCILNKEYPKEEYEVLKERIIADMKANPYVDKAGRVWSYGEFMPFEVTPYSYNETVAQEFFPLTKEQVLAKGMDWYDQPEPSHTITMTSADLPQSAGEITDSIVQEILQCATCTLPYRVTDPELYLLTKNNLPLPSSCWKCRHKRRFDRANKPELYDRNCDKCGKDIQTSYSPDRPEIVYCEKCYQQEMV